MNISVAQLAKLNASLVDADLFGALDEGESFASPCGSLEVIDRVFSRYGLTRGAALLSTLDEEGGVRIPVYRDGAEIQNLVIEVVWFRIEDGSYVNHTELLLV